MTKQIESTNSVGLFIDKQDATVALAIVRAIGNRALTKLINLGQRTIRRDAARERAGEDALSLDERNEQDANMVDRAPPVGLDPAEPLETQLAYYARLYRNCFDRCQTMGDNEYDLPQDVKSRVEWLLEQSVENQAKPKLGADATRAEKLAALSRIGAGEAEAKFWRSNAAAVTDLVQSAIDAAEDYDEALDVLTGVEAHQAMVQGLIGLNRAMVRLAKVTGRFKATSEVGRRIASDFGALEAALETSTAFVAQLETAYASEIMAAITAGANLKTTEDAEGIIDAALG